MNTEKMMTYLEQGYNCSQTVFTYFATTMGMDEDLAMRIATPFEMGMYRADTCGAISGAYMALGLKYGTTDFEGKMKLRELTARLIDDFNEEMKSIKCGDLIGFNINEDLQRAIDEGKLESVCGSCIPKAIEITEKIIEQTGESL